MTFELPERKKRKKLRCLKTKDKGKNLEQSLRKRICDLLKEPIVRLTSDF